MLAFKNRRRVAIVGAAAVSALCAGSVHAQYRLQHANSIDLSSVFFGEGAMGEPASVYGSNPLSVTMVGGNAFIGGFNGTTLSSGSVGLVRVDNILSLASSINPLANTTFTAGPARGLDYLAGSGASVFGVYDDGVGNGFVAGYDTNGNTQWNVPTGNIAAGYRPSAIAIDPLADNGQPALGLIGVGSGRRAAMRLSNGEVIYGPSGFPGTLGDIVNPNPSMVEGIALGFTYRGLAFDSEGNIAVAANGGASYGVRDTQGDTNFNRFVNLDGVASATTPIAAKQLNTGNALFVGQPVSFLEGLGTETLLAVSGRVGEPFELTLRSAVVGVPALTGLDSRDVHILGTTGALPGQLDNPTLSGDEDGIGPAWDNEVKGMATGLDANGNPVLLVLSYTQRRLDVYNLEPTWTNSGGGVWSNSGNWLLGAVPGSALDNARFGGAITSASTVIVDGAKTVKVINFDNPNAYLLSGAGSITLNSPGTPQINVATGNHTINVPVTLAKDTRVNVAPGNTLSVFSFTGAGLAIDGGTVRLLPNGSSAATSRVTSLEIAGGVSPTATLDITNNAVVVDYDDESPFSTVRAQIISAYNNGAWDGLGITSSLANASSHGIGYAEAAALTSIPAIFGTVDNTAVLLRYTRYGDANLDGTVNLADFNRLAANFGTSGANWDQGDFTYDGLVNLADFNRLAANFGLQAGPDGPTPEDWSALAAVVPEPSSMALVGAAVLLSARRRRH